MAAQVDGPATPSRPVLFLDVDGVLNTTAMNGARSLHPKLVGRLAELVRETRAEIVLSSSWRLYDNYKEVLFVTLTEAGLDVDGIGSTPRFTPTFEFKPLAEGQRAAEILAWLRDHRGLHLEGDALPKASKTGGTPTATVVDTSAAPATPVAWAAVDDLDLELPLSTRALFRGHFCRTQSEAGLSAACCKALRAMLQPELAVFPDPDTPTILEEGEEDEFTAGEVAEQPASATPSP